MIKSKKINFLKNSVWSFLISFFSRLGGLIFMIIIARFLLPEKFGVYTLAMSTTLILLAILDTGFNQTLIKFTSKYIEKDKKKAASVSNYLFNFKLNTSLIISIALLISSYPLSYLLFNKPDLFMPLIFASLYLFITSITTFFSSLFYSIEKVKYIATKEILFEVVRIFLVIIMFLVVATQHHVMGIISVLIFSNIVLIFYLRFNLKKESPELFKNQVIQINRKKINRFTIFLGIIGTFSIIFAYIDTIIIGMFLESKYIGFYAAAMSLTVGIASLINISYILLPFFTNLHSDDLERAVNSIMRYIFIITFPAIFGLAILSKYIIRLIYGYEYIPAVFPLYILSLLILIQPMLGALVPLFYIREKTKQILIMTFVYTILNIFLNFIFIIWLLRFSPELAISGAAIASILTQGGYLISLMFYAKKDLSININISHMTKPIISSLIMAGVLVIINFQIRDFNIFIGILNVITGILVYFISMFLINGIGKPDIEILKDFLKNI